MPNFLTTTEQAIKQDDCTRREAMVYAVVVEKTDSAINVGAYDGRPLVPVVAFDSIVDFRAYQDWLWEGDRYTGKNLIRVSRKQVERWFGKDYELGDYPLAILGGIGISQIYRAGDGWMFGRDEAMANA